MTRSHLSPILVVLLATASAGFAHDAQACRHCAVPAAEFARREAVALSRIGSPPPDFVVPFGYAVTNARPDVSTQIEDLGRYRAAYCETHAEECAKARGLP
jgi:hypothetical protein